MSKLKLVVAAVAAFVMGGAFATDLVWKNWDGDCKAGTASNWEPEQVPVEGDNIIVNYDGSGTKYWHNNLSITYGHITFSVTNSASTRLDPDTNEIKVSNGIDFIGSAGTVYFRTALTGTGDFVMNWPDSTCYLATTPTSGNVYAGDFYINLGTVNIAAAGVTGDAERHGKIYIDATSRTEYSGKYGKIGQTAGTIYNDIYHKNNTSWFAFYPSGNTTFYGDLYFTGGNGTIQGGSDAKVSWYGKWIRWTPEDVTTETSHNTYYKIFVTSNSGQNGLCLYGGYEDPYKEIFIYNNVNTLVRIGSKIDVPKGIFFDGDGKVVFEADDVQDVIPLRINKNCVIDMGGTKQTIGDITAANTCTNPTFITSISGGKLTWKPTTDATFPAALNGDFGFAFDADGVTGTIGSALVSSLEVKAGSLAVSEDAALNNVTAIMVANGASLALATGNINDGARLTVLGDADSFTIAAGKTVTVAKAVIDGQTLTAGDYVGVYGEGTLKVKESLFIWTNTSGDGNLLNPDNWNMAECPQYTDNVRFAAGESGIVTLTGGALECNRCEIADGTTLQLPANMSITAVAFQFGEGAKIVGPSSAKIIYPWEVTLADLPIEGGMAVVFQSGATFTSTDISDRALRIECESGDITIPGDIKVYSYKYNGTYQNPGASNVGVIGGSLQVLKKPGTPDALWTWTGNGGEDDKSITSDVNWQNGVAPNFNSGLARVQFPAGVEVSIEEVVRVYSIEFVGAATINDLSGNDTGKLYVGEGGATLTKEVIFNVPVEFTASQTWAVNGDKDTHLVFNKALGASNTLDDNSLVVFAGDATGHARGEMSCVDFKAACADEMNIGVCVSNALFRIDNGNCCGTKYGFTAFPKEYNNTDDPGHYFKAQCVVNFPCNFYGWRNEMVQETNPTYHILTFNYPVFFGFDTDSAVDDNQNNHTVLALTVRNSLIFNAPVTADGAIYSIAVFGTGVDKGVFFNDTLTFLQKKRYFTGGEGYHHFNAKVTGWERLAPNSGAKIQFGLENATPAETPLIYNTSAIFDLNGYDQTFPALWPTYTKTGATVAEFTSTRAPATLHLTKPQDQADMAFKYTGLISLELNTAAGKTVNLMNGVSTTHGALILNGGTFVIKDAGRWHGKGKIRIASGATLETAVDDALGSADDGYKAQLVVAEGGVVKLTNSARVRSAIYNEQKIAPGTYYAEGSGQEKTLSFLSGSGSLTIDKDPPANFILWLE